MKTPVSLKIEKLKREASAWKSMYDQKQEEANRAHSKVTRLEDLLMRMMQVHTEVVNELQGFNE